jgi:hypothetical protein
VPLGRSGCRRARHGGAARGARGGPAVGVQGCGGRRRGCVHELGVEAGASRVMPEELPAAYRAQARSARVDCGWGGGGR